jgi:hypothetical protein
VKINFFFANIKKMFKGFHKREHDFQTKIMKARQVNAEPPPQTRAEAKEQNKRRYLPGERLQIKLNKQVSHEKKKEKELDEDDIDRITKSMNKIMASCLVRDN